MTSRNFGLTSRAAFVDGGTNPQPGSLDAGTKYNPHIDNLIKFPAPSLPDKLELPSGAPHFIQDETGVACALAVVVSCFVTALSALLYAGYKLFFLFDLG